MIRHVCLLSVQICTTNGRIQPRLEKNTNARCSFVHILDMSRTRFVLYDFTLLGLPAAFSCSPTDSSWKNSTGGILLINRLSRNSHAGMFSSVFSKNVLGARVVFCPRNLPVTRSVFVRMRTGMVSDGFYTKFLEARILSSKKIPLTIYERHQIAINELEVGAVGTDFSRRPSGWAREDPGRARTWKSMKNMHFSEMYTNARSNQQFIKLIYFWIKLNTS
jgi:hypothetical protein